MVATAREQPHLEPLDGPGRDVPPNGALVARVHDALNHLHDPAYLQTHPLTRHVQQPASGQPSARRAVLGRVLRQALVEAIEALHPGRESSSLARHSQLLQLRYLDGLSVPEVQERLGISRTEFYREHRKAIGAVASILSERWAIDGRTDGGRHGADKRSSPQSLELLEISQGAPCLEEPSTPSHNLPLQLTPLVGRETELATVRQRLLDPATRLLTLVGPGGIGKTRLALQVAAEVVGQVPDGVCFVSLSSVQDADLVVPAVAQALGLRAAGDRPLVEQLAIALRDQALLLVLDNFEQVVEAASWVTSLLTQCPHVRVLATSRMVLHVSGEHDFPVPPLPLPDLHPLPPLPEVARNAAVALFVQRVQSVRPGFVLTESNVLAVVDICRQLEGIPLAIELAAAWSRVLPPEVLLARLSSRLTLLSGGPRDQPARHHTMRDAIAWSHDLLSADERALFRRLAAFSGGFTLEAAEAVTGAAAGGAMDVLTGVASLIDKSLLAQVEQPGGELRFRMLETVREYGLEQLVESGEEAAINRRLAAWCLALAERGFAGLFGREHREWLVRLDTEYGNLRAVLAWLFDQRDYETAQRLAHALCRFWFARGRLTEGRMWSERALASGGETSGPVRAGALAAAGFLSWAQGDYPRASGLIDEALALLREEGSPLYAETLFLAGQVATDLGESDRARTILEEALTLCRAVGEMTYVAFSLNALGLVVYRQERDLDRAEEYFAEALQQFRELYNPFGSGLALTNLARIARNRGDYPRAASLYAEALGLHWDDGDNGQIATCLSGLGMVAALTGQAERAARLLGAAEALGQAIGPRVPRYPGQYQRAVASARAALGDQAFDEAWAAGRGLPLAEAVDEARTLPVGTLEKSRLADGVTAAAARYGLTRREMDVLRLLPRGLTNREIGRALVIAERTAATHVQNIFAKLGVGSRAEAVALAVQESLL